MIYPSKEVFLKLSDSYNMIPVYSEVAADMETPVSAYFKISTSEKESAKYSFLLESVEGGENIARYSFLGARPHSVLVQNKGKAKLIKDGKDEGEVEGKDVFERIKNFLSRYKTADILEFSPFTGGAVGYVSYDVINEIENSVPAADKETLDVPEAVFMLVDSFFIFDRVKQIIKVVSYAFLDRKCDPEKEYQNAAARIEKQIELLKQPVFFSTD